MTQTDRQTDKATHWKSAIFDCGENFSEQWAALDKPPSFVKRIHRKREICPTTGREHEQVHVECNKQVRLSSLTSWIKHTKWFMVLGKEHIENSIKYIGKEETTAPGAKLQVIENTESYMRLSEIMSVIARYFGNSTMLVHGMYINENDWEHITAKMVDEDVTWVNKLCNPTLPKMWKTWGHIFIRKYKAELEELGGSHIIEDPTLGEEFVEYKFLD